LFELAIFEERSSAAIAKLPSEIEFRKRSKDYSHNIDIRFAALWCEAREILTNNCIYDKIIEIQQGEGNYV